MEKSFEKALSYEGVELLRLEARKFDTPAEYVESLSNRYRYNLIIQAVRRDGATVEPYDRSTGQDYDRPVANAMFKGALLAMRLLDEFMPTSTRLDMLEPRPNIDTEIKDEFQLRHLVAEEIIDQGDRGYAMAANYHALIEEWEDELCPSVVDQPFLKRGFGLVFYKMNYAWDKHVDEQMGLVESDPAWTEDLRGLLGEE